MNNYAHFLGFFFAIFFLNMYPADLKEEVLTWNEADGVGWGPVNDVAWHPSHPDILLSAGTEMLKIWDVSNWKESKTRPCLKPLQAIMHEVEGDSDCYVCDETKSSFVVDWDPEGTRFASGGEGCTLKTWDAENGKCIRKYHGIPDDVIELKYSSDGRCIAGAFRNGMLRVFDGRSKDLVGGDFSGSMYNQAIREIAFSPDGNQLAIAADSLYMLDLKAGINEVTDIVLRKNDTPLEDCLSVKWTDERFIAAAKTGIRLKHKKKVKRVERYNGRDPWAVAVYKDRIIVAHYKESAPRNTLISFYKEEQSSKVSAFAARYFNSSLEDGCCRIHTLECNCDGERIVAADGIGRMHAIAIGEMYRARKEKPRLSKREREELVEKAIRSCARSSGRASFTYGFGASLRSFIDDKELRRVQSNYE